MAKFSDLDPECQRELAVICSCLHVAAESLAESTETSTAFVQRMLVEFVKPKLDKLSDRQIALLVKQLDDED